LFWCGTYFSSLGYEHILQLYENRVLRRIFGPVKEIVTGDWRKLHSDKLHNLYSSPNMKDGLDVACSTHREMRNAYDIVVQKPEGKRLI
jgi:hypothetical protein